MTAIQRWRIALVLLGLVLLSIGGITLLDQVPPARYPGIALWLLGALILHDGIGAMAVFGVSVLARRAQRIPLPVVLIVQGAAAIVVIVVVLVLPEIVKRAIGTANPSILPLDYIVNLALFCAGVVTAAGVAIVAYLLVTRRSARVRQTGSAVR
ncbi:MAG: hypothetical protein ABJB03_03265 [Rhodoglobus sp.]